MIKGFFKQYDIPKRESRSNRQGICPCGLETECSSPYMKVTGEGRAGILIIAEAPGKEEDETGMQLVGPAGQVLRKHLKLLGVDLDQDCRKTNAVRCRPPHNRAPTPKELSACRNHIFEEIISHPPKTIILLGGVALNTFLAGRTKKAPGPIGHWRGFQIPDQRHHCWVCPTFHPSYILRAGAGRQIRGKSTVVSIEEKFFGLDLANAVHASTRSFPKYEIPIPQIEKECPAALPTSGLVAVDFETTTLRPWESRASIISCGLCFSGRRPGAFPIQGSQDATELRRLLCDPRVKKIAHNIKFEKQWADSFFNIQSRGWEWDSMLASHLIDNRSGITSLKRQAFLHLGIEDWSKEITFSADLKATEELLRYNATDAWACLMLSSSQRKLFKC